MELIKMDLLTKIVTSILWTGYVQNAEKPLSLLIIAAPEHGKSQLVKQFRYSKGIIYISDVTTYGLASKINEHLNRHEPVNHIIIPDLLNPFSRAKCVVQSFVSFLNALTEEGIAKIQTGRITVEIPMQCGVIACLTTDQWKQHRAKWISIGFLSRFIPLSYRYSRPTVMEIFDKLSGAGAIENDVNINFPNKKQIVNLTPELHKQLDKYAISIARASNLEGIRLYRDLGILAKGIALRENRVEVIQADIDEIISCTDYINYNFNMV